MGTTPADDASHPPEDAGARSLFFSYARADQQRVLPVIHALERCGHHVWWDGLIESGARFAQQTEQALEEAGAVIVAWSAHSVGSHWVNDEAASARDRGVLVPVSLDGSPAPIGFRQFQVIDLSAWSGDIAATDFQRVLRGIDAVGVKPRAMANALASRPLSVRRGLSRRAVMLGAAGTAGLAGLAGAWRFGLLGGSEAGRSIAVLPFENIGSDRSRDYFAEGLSAELRDQLSQNIAIRVIAQSSSTSAAEGAADAAAIARRLGVAYLLEGNVRWAGDAVRIAANLIDPASDSNRWSKTFDLRMDDIFAVQSEIAAAVTAAISSQIVDAAGTADVGGTTDATAYDQYLRGRDLYSRASSEAMDMAALAHFDAAIAADPRFAAAYAARASSLTLIGSLYGDLAETHANYDAALVAARRAVAIAPDEPKVQSTLGFVLSQGHLNIRAARAPFERSRLLGNGDANVLARYAQFAAQTGRFEAAGAAIDRAKTLDPLNPLMAKSTALIAYWSRDYPAARSQIARSLALSPDLGAAHAVLGDILLMQGDSAAARDAYLRESNPLLRETGLAIATFELGQRAAADATRQRIVEGLGTGQVTHYQQAQIAAQRGELVPAIAALRAALVAGDSGMINLKVDPMLDPVREQAAFDVLLRDLHFI